MKVDTSRLKKGTSEVPPECQNLIDKLKSCNRNELIEELAKIETWTFGKCELFHWIDILDIFDEILEEATHYEEHPIYITCDTPPFEKGRKLLLLVLNFTTLLIEHSFSRHLYNSVEHLTQLLLSTDLEIILGVLNLLYMFSKRSNFISRLSSHKKNTLLNRLRHIAEPYGGKECGFGLADCCRPDQKMPKAIYHFYYEYYTKTGALQVIDHQNISKHDPKSITVKLWKDLDQHLDDDQKYHLFARARLATGFWNYENRILFVQARLQALSILVYSDALMGYTPTLIYPGFLEELVELLELQQPNLVEIRAAALRTLTAIIHLERNSQYQRKSESRLNTIIEVTGASSYHGFLPTLVRNCIVNLTGSNNKSTTPTTPSYNATEQQKSSSNDDNLFPLQLATALFSFLYHLASYEPGAESLVSCGMMESLLRVINWSGSELEHITFVTRAVRVIDLITNLDMQSFQTNYGLNTFIKRLNMEVNLCRKEQSYEIKPNIENPAEHDKNITHIDEAMDTGSQYGDDDICMSASTSANLGMTTSTQSIDGSGSGTSILNKSSEQQQLITNRTCLPQRAALLKSMLNFLKKAIQDIAFSDSIRHIMEATLPESLKHIISNSEYYGPSLFLLATDVVTVYVFQEPSLLSSLQDNGLTDVVLQALLKKDVPATREVLGSLPNVFSALCLNTRGMESFLKYNPFDKLFRVFISPVYLSAMRRRRSSDPLGDTASNIGNAMDELMRNQPSLKTPAIKAIIKLLEEIVDLGTDPKYVCWRAQNKNDVSPQMPNSRQANSNHNNGGSSDEDEDDEEEVSTSSHNQAQGQTTAAGNEEVTNSNQAQPQQGTSQSTFTSQASSPTERIPIALIDYILNTMKFLEAILSNNSTDDHCREFVNLGGLKSLLSILALPNLPVTSLNSPITATAQAVASVCKSILNLTHEPQVLQVALEQLSVVVESLQSLMNNQEHTSSSVLLKELANCQDINHAFTNANYTPLLHAMSAVHGYVLMLVHVCRSGQSDIRTLSLIKWGQDNETGIKLLKKLVMLYTGLVWESTLLLALCTDDIVPAGSEFSKDEMEKLGASDVKNVIEVNWDEIVTNLAVMENLTPIPSSSSNMDVDGSSTGALRKIKQPDASMKFVTSQSQLKYIKSLLGASSRLGRALAELFGLLVRLCVGSPLRQRRGQNFIPATSFTSPTAKEIARILSFILVDGLSFQKLPASPVPKLKLTFLICSIGFTSPMLFDEKRFAYHLMLYKFIEEGGLEAYFEMFRWTLTAGYTIPIHRAIEHPNLPDGTGEALDAWLMLLEKMTNLKYIIESPHQITSKNRTGKPDFDTKHYLTYIHRNAFLAIQHIWGFKPLKSYGLRMTESMLSILKHVIKGEKVLQSKYYKNGQGVSISLDNKSKSIMPGSETVAAATDVNQEHLRQLVDMGFSREQSVYALQRYLSLEGATEYLLTNPRNRSILFDVVSDDERSVVANSNPVPINMDIDVGEEDEHVIRAILNSLGNDRPTTSASGNSMEISPGTSKNTLEGTKDDKTKGGETSKNRQKEIMKKYLIEQPLPKKTIDDFTSSLLKTCLNILDQLPETVYKICDLLITVTKRNGPIWRDEMLDTLCKEIFNCIQFLIGILVDDGTKNYKEKSEKLVSGDMANKTAVRIHLFTLFFQGQYQDMKVPCANALNSYNIIPRLIKVLTDYQMIVTMMNKALPTPKWLAPLALLLDLYDKVALSTKQKQQMHKICTQQWQWYDISSSKWTNYLPQQNKLINDAYMAGESELQLMVGRHRYTINFKSMSQINDESSNHRPIIMALRSIETMNNPTNAFDEKAEDAEQQQASGSDPIIASSSMATTITESSSIISVQTVHPTTTATSSTEVTVESVNLMDVDTPAKNYIKMLEEIELEPLSSFVPEEIVSSCVQLMAHQQLDRDTLHAIMRVLVRLTKNYTLAEVFARFGGIDVLLNMKQNSGFIGFTTLATLLIRHVIEEPKTLSLAIQNVLVNRTLVTIPPGHRELVFLIRQLNSAVYRDPELFKEAALKILRVDFDSMKRSQIPDEKRFIMRSLPLSTNMKYNMEQSTAMSAVCKLLKALIEPDEPGSNIMWMQAEKSKDSQGAARKEKFTAEPQPQQSSQSSSDDQKEKQGSMSDKPLMNKSAILKILAESVKSYQTVALHITEHLYRAGSSSLINEDTTALSFILDKMFHICDANMDRECPTMAQNLISAIASSDVTQAQETVVHEVKMALQRALNEPESTEKHLHIEGLATLIPAMIDSNNSGNTEGSQFFKTSGQSQVRHNIFYIMVEKGIITDIARAAQYLELGGPNTIATLNHLMKPLEMLLRLTNEPMPSMPSSSKFKKMPTQRRSQTAQSESDGIPAPPIVEQETLIEATEQQNNQTNSEALSNNVNATMTTVSAGTSINPINNQNRSTATNSDSTNAQDEQMLADDSEQNTDRDMSSAAIDSLVGENELGDHIGEVHLNEILDTLISEELRGINEYAEDANQDDNNDEEVNEGGRRRMIRDNVELMHVLGEESSSDSDDSESNASDNEEREMDEVEEIENDEDEEEENEERSELDDDEETQPFEMYDRHSMYGRHLSPSIPEIERDHEDILMIQYSNNAQNNVIANNNTETRENRVVRDRDSQIGGNINISVTNNEANANIVNEQPQNFLFNANFPLLYNENSEPGVNDSSNPAQGAQSTSTNDTTSATINTNAPPPNNHPLLSGRPDGISTDRTDDRLHVGEGLQTARRSNRTRTRYQFINVNTRNQPIILQRMLELRHNRQAGQNAGNDPFLFRDGTRVVVMDNGFSIFSNGDDLDLEMVDQSGYWFGRTLANHLNNHPSALSWWQEENKISGPDSNSDLCMVMCDEMIPEIDAARTAELSKMRGKRKKKLLEEEEAKQRNQDGKKTNDEETAEIHVQPEVALSSVLTSVPVPIEPIRLAEPIPNNNNNNNNEFSENLSNANNLVQQQLLPNASSTTPSSNNLNISFMDVHESEQNNDNAIPQVIQPITISTQIVSPPQHITTDNQLNLDLDVEMASDNEESSASANNSRSFSPNYSPNSNQIETGELNMLNRETPSSASNEQNQVSNMNIQDQNQSPTTQQMEQDHPMADSENGELINSMAIEASQIPLPIDDSDNTDSGDDSDDDDDDDDDEKPIELAVSNNQADEEANASTEQIENVENVEEEDEDEASGTTVMIQNIDPAIRAVLGDMEVPEGVDPSFLAALPPELRDEVVQEHIRQQRIRQRAQASVALQEAQAMADVNPEFLAALPLNIQEEVLAQQRLEQQRQAAAAANPNDPVNAAEFFQNLQPSLRQAILTDMEDSQISALPPDLAAEAQTLRRDWETRNRQMQERILSSSFTNALRAPGNRNPRVFVPRQHLLGFGTTGTHTMALTRNHTLTQTSITSNMERQGAPLLDQESLASILVLLFIDDPNIGTLRLYRVIRNLCFHIPTRKWIIKSLLSIIMRCNEESMEHYLEPTSSKKSNRDDDKVKWLKLRLDSALGGRANVFLKKLEKVGSNNVPLTIHPKASPTVCRHTLDLLIFLAKTFPIHFLPPSRKNANHPSNSSNETSDSMPSTSAQALQRDRSTDFWDILLRLDNEIDDRSKKGAKIRSACKQIKEFCEQDIKSFAESPFGQLITMLSYDIIRKNTMLTDKLLRLLSLISIILADDKYKNNNLSKPPQQQQQIQNQQQPSEETNAAPSSSSAEKPSNEIVKAQDNNNDMRERLPESERHLALTVDVLTSKSCSEDGLEDATSLLINLSQCSSMTKYMIIKLLVKGVIDLSHMVQKHINNLMVELRELNETIKNEKLKPESNNDDSDELSKPSTSRGTLKDRFTKDAVIITAPSKVKTSNDLQLPSMAPLLSKTSNQSFFLRILKVITQIRDTVRQDSKVCDADVEQQLVKLETVPLSELLDLDSLWNTLSDCLKELEETQDHHAVLVLQPTVEAFFIVHSAPQVKTTIAERNLAARSLRNAGTAANPEAPQRDNNDTAQNANNNQANEERSNQENNTEQQQQQPQQVHLNIPIDETAAAAAAVESNSEAGTSHERLSPMDTTQSSDGSVQASSSTGGLQQQVSQQNLTPDQKKFLHFAETHRVVLNQILRQSSVHLADGPFAVLVDHTRVLDFDVKRRYFRIELERLDDGVRREEVAVHVHRANVFEDSFRELYRRSPEEWKNRFYIVFEDEEGQDAGGLLREWYMIISREIFNPMYALFTVSPGDRVTYMINPSSHCNPNHLCYFKFVGRVIAKAIYDNKLLECYFTRAFYKHILGIQVKYTDMESEDYAFYQGLVYLMENHVESLGYDLTFSLEIQEFGVTEVRELKPNGGNIAVTEENKLEYIQLVCQLKMSGSIKQQLNAFLEGFYDIIPKRLISIFNEQELELLISGLPNIDIEDLRANTEYHKYQATSIQIQWFWRALRSFDQAERAKFLQFVTGTSKVPLQGFGALEGMNGIQKFQIHRDDRSTDRLPSAHTCFNQLDLPVYKSYDKLRTNLMKAIHECSEGFGFA
ncbi:hypothetical protein ACKWTF_001914 [Chironomus riparius]